MAKETTSEKIRQLGLDIKLVPGIAEKDQKAKVRLKLQTDRSKKFNKERERHPNVSADRTTVQRDGERVELQNRYWDD